MSVPIALQHLMITGAGLPAPASQPLSATLPNLARLLGRMAPVSHIRCAPDSPNLPWELALAPLLGLPAQVGLIPWAAFDTGTIGTPCAWLSPCHWQAGADHILLTDPADLQLDEAISRTLLDAAAPYFLEDGIELHYHRPGAWLATGEVFRHLPTRALARVVGRPITPAVFDVGTPAGVVLRRLQNEMQMLFYTHPANDARQAQGLRPVNSYWVSGAGVLDAVPGAIPGLLVERRLQALHPLHAPQAHQQAWQAVDADACARLLNGLQQGQPVQLTLCGDQQAQTWQAAPPSLLGKIKHVLGLQPTLDMRHTL